MSLEQQYFAAPCAHACVDQNYSNPDEREPSQDHVTGTALNALEGWQFGRFSGQEVYVTRQNVFQVRQHLLTKHTEIEFRLKTTKSAKDFTPKIGAKLPKGVKPDGLPSKLTQQIP
jgi:hypothetical protein